MSKAVCKFYMKGLCKYGSSCRFLHSDHSNEQYYDEYRPRKHANREYNNEKSNYDESYDHYDYEQSNYQPNVVNQHSKKKNNSKSNYNRKNAYNYDNEDNYHSNKNHYNEYNYHSNKNHYNEDNYHSNYNSNDNYHYSKQKENNVKNYYKVHNTEENYMNSNYYNEGRHFKDNNGEQFTNSNRNSNYHFGYQQGSVQEREAKLKYYDKEVKSYVSHISHLSLSTIWPLTCFQPIGNSYPIQPVGSLNLLEVSFEEIRCDYYSIKNIVPDPISIHKYFVDEVLFKARQMKENIISFVEHVQIDMLATFEKCEQSKINPSFQNTIQADPNSYWDMSLRYLINSLTTKSEIDSFSFALDKETTQKAPPSKILMQVETYGQVDSEAYAQENFTDFIPIMPPPRKFC